MNLTDQQVSDFQEIVHEHFRNHGRNFPWRDTTDPYAILVSEIMLQQTQAPRVVPKYVHFLAAFPTLESLAKASLADVLSHWQGLGYNRRGLMLYRLSQEVVANHAATLPKTPAELAALPGIGPYTAAAIVTFAFNQPVVMLETNIRSVYIHTFFPDQESVTDSEIEKLIAQTLDSEHPREWYQALMDYGNWLKEKVPNPSRRSRQYAKQTPLKGSNREVRGAILRALTSHSQLKTTALASLLQIESRRITPALTQLTSEGFITHRGDTVALREG